MPTLAALVSADPKLYTFSRNDWIPGRPEVLWKIQRGAVRTVTWNEEGTQITLGFWGSGDVIGTPLAAVNPYKIECLTTVQVSLMPPQLWHEIIDEIVSHAQQTQILLTIVRSERVHLGLRQLLIWLSQKFGRPVDKGRLVELRLTHQQLAESIGTSRVTVTRLLKKFKEEGAIAQYGRSIILLQKNGRLLLENSLGTPALT